MPPTTTSSAPYLLAPNWLLKIVAPGSGGVNLYVEDVANVINEIQEQAPSPQHAQAAIEALQDLVLQSQEKDLATVSLIDRSPTKWVTDFLVKEMVMAESEAADFQIRGRI